MKAKLVNVLTLLCLVTYVIAQYIANLFYIALVKLGGKDGR
jgi:hypothetical protein